MTAMMGIEREIPRGLISNIQRFSIHDGAGIRTLVFFKGCHLRCLWCSNPETQSLGREIKFAANLCLGCGRCVEVCPTGAASVGDRIIAIETCIGCGKCVQVCPGGARKMVGQEMTVDEVMSEVVKDMPFYRRSGGGVTLTGGEPLVQLNFALAILKECQKKGIDTAIETCGAVPWERIERILPYLDLVLFDIKQMDSQAHKNQTGHDNRLILKNAAKISASGARLIIRVPVVPGLTDSVKNIQRIVDFANTLEGVEEVHLLPFHRLGESKYKQLGKAYHLENLKPLDDSALKDLTGSVKKGRIRVQMGG